MAYTTPDVSEKAVSRQDSTLTWSVLPFWDMNPARPDTKKTAMVEVQRLTELTGQKMTILATYAKTNRKKTWCVTVTLGIRMKAYYDHYTVSTLLIFDLFILNFRKSIFGRVLTTILFFTYI